MKLRQKDIQEIFAFLSMKRLTGWQDMKQQINFSVGPVYFLIINVVWTKHGFLDLNHLPYAQQNTQNQKPMCLVIYS